MSPDPKMNSKSPSPEPFDESKACRDEDAGLQGLNDVASSVKTEDADPNATESASETADKDPSSKANSPARPYYPSSNGAEDTSQQSPEATFPQQLMDVIESESENGALVDGKRVIEWLPDGNSFVIRDKGVLERDVLPKYFSAKCKFMSFVRKLYR